MTRKEQLILDALYMAAEALQDCATFGNAPDGYWDKNGTGYEANMKVLQVLNILNGLPT